MRKVLISFGSPAYYGALRTLAVTAKPYFDDVILYRPDDLSEMFRGAYAKVLSERRGFGCWAWKAWCVLKTLGQVADGDVVMYADSQAIVLNDPAPLFDLGPIVLFHQKREGHKNRTWTKRDCFARMGCDSPEFWDGDNLVAGVQLYHRTPEAMAFVSEMLEWCADYHAISDAPNVCGLPNLPGFRDHRHDQSILSIQAIRHGLRPFNDPTQYGCGYPADRPGGQIVEIWRRVRK